MSAALSERVIAAGMRRFVTFRRCFSSRTTDGIIQLGAKKPNTNVLELSKKSNKQSENGSGRKPLSLGSVAMLAVPAAALSLGFWQVYRWQWKLGLISELEGKLHLPAIEFPFDNLLSLEELEYRSIRIKGEFLHDREFLISPRGRFDPGRDDKGGGLIADSNMSSHGAHVVTPFKLHGTNLIILVNRGWVPNDRSDPRTRQSGQISGPVEFEATVRKSEGRPQFIGENIPERGVWYYKNFEQMAKRYDTSPIYVEAKYESSVDGGPIGGQTNINVRNEHLSYIVTWFSLSAVTTAMWFMKFMK